LTLGVVRDLRSARAPVGPEELAAFETDVMAEFVMARSAAGLADSTIRGEVGQLDRVRVWFDRPVWEMDPSDADTYFGQELRAASKATRLARAQAIRIFFAFLQMRHAAQIHVMTGRVVTCPVDEMNQPRGAKEAKLRVPPGDREVEDLFSRWAVQLTTCRKFAPTARNYTAARLMATVGLRVNEARRLDLADLKWDLGRLGKIHVRHGKGSRGSGPRERMVPMIGGADRLLRWYVEDVWGHLDDDHARPGAPLFCSERRNLDGTKARVGDDVLREGLARAAATHLPAWASRLTPHVLRHYCASQLYRTGMDLIMIQELLGHAWIATTMGYVHVHRSHVEDAWIAGQARAAARLGGLI